MESKAQKSLRNAVFGIIAKILQLLLPFLVRTIIIYRLGIAYAGINSLFVSLFNILNLTELGVGAALNYFMYKPIADHDVPQMNAIIRLYDKWYRAIGILVTLLGLAILPFVPRMSPADFPSELDISLVYVLFLTSMVLPYFTAPYAVTVLSAHLREDLVSKAASVCIITQSLLQIAAIWCFHNYYLYIVSIILSALLNALLLFVYYRRQYPAYRCEGDVPPQLMKEILSRIKALFLHKIGGVVLFSADNLVISALLGQTMLGIYGNYYMIITALSMLLDAIFNAFRAAVGNDLVTESVERNFERFQRLCFCNLTTLGICTSILVCTFQRFISLWTGQENLLSFRTILWLCGLFYLLRMDAVVGVYRTALGLWLADKWRPLLSSVCNLLVNIFLTRRIGIDGIVISSIISILGFHFFNTARILHNQFFDRSSIPYYLAHFRHDAVNLLACLLAFTGCRLLVSAQGVVGLLLCGVLSAGISAAVILLLHSKNPYLKEILLLARQKIGKFP